MVTGAYRCKQLAQLRLNSTTLARPDPRGPAQTFSRDPGRIPGSWTKSVRVRAGLRQSLRTLSGRVRVVELCSSALTSNQTCDLLIVYLTPCHWVTMPLTCTVKNLFKTGLFSQLIHSMNIGVQVPTRFSYSKLHIPQILLSISVFLVFVIFFQL